MLRYIESSRIRLRPFTAADDAFLHSLDNDQQVMRWINGGLIVTLEYIQTVTLPLFMRIDDVDTSLGFWCVELVATGDTLGWVSLRQSGEKDVGELGYRFATAFWGHGYATEAASMLLTASFHEGSGKRVIASTFEENVGSIAVMKKLGMTLRRRYRMAKDDLKAPGTSLVSDELWDGDDVEYGIDGEAFIARYRAMRPPADA